VCVTGPNPGYLVMFADGGAGLKRTARGIVIHRAGGSSVQQALCASRGLFLGIGVRPRNRNASDCGTGGRWWTATTPRCSSSAGADVCVYTTSRGSNYIHTRCIYKRRFGKQIPGVYLRVYTTSHGSKSTLGAFTNDVLESKFRACFCACIRRLTAQNPHLVHLQTTF